MVYSIVEKYSWRNSNKEDLELREVSCDIEGNQNDQSLTEKAELRSKTSQAY